MEQRFYKVRLGSGRVLGPIDLDRIKALIYKDKISGLESVRLYPNGDWKDINSYPEIADLLLAKLEGRMIVPGAKELAAVDEDEKNAEVPIELSPAAASPPDAKTKKTDAHEFEFSVHPEPPPAPDPTKPVHTATVPVNAADGEATVIVDKNAMKKSSKLEMDGDFFSPNAVTDNASGDDERTIIAPSKTKKIKDLSLESNPSSDAVVEMAEAPAQAALDPGLAAEKTAMMSVDRNAPRKKGQDAKSNKRKTIFIGIALVFGVLFLLMPDTEKKKPEPPFRVELPNTAEKSDPIQSEKLFMSGLPVYSQDTVEGYKRASRIFLQAASQDPNNVKALCFLASSYLNLIDVVNRDENYFNVVTKLIELERAKNLDLAETVVADVELYHVLGNPDAAISRLLEFSKSHAWGFEMLYYLALSFYLKGDAPGALAQLNKIDPKSYFSPKIQYLYGLIYLKTAQYDDAARYFREVIGISPTHVKARVKLAEIYFHKDNLPESGKQADYVIQHESSASREELSKAYYYRARMHEVGARDLDAVSDLELALKNNPEDQDVLLEYYTLRAKVGAKLKDPQGKAKMFNFLALGERALMDNRLDEALGQFINAREAQYGDPTPRLRLAEVFRRKGDLRGARDNFREANELAPKRADIYPKYIRALIDSYEFDEAKRVIAAFKELQPPEVTIHRLEGDLYLKEQHFPEAAIYYKKALGGSNSDSSIYIAYASLLFKIGNFREAAFYYGLAQRFDPFNIEATIGIGKSLSEVESMERGVEYVQNALQNSPEKALLLNGIAEIYLRKGDYASALKFVQNALTIDTKYPAPYKTKGEILAAQERTKEALDSYLTYINLAPLDPTGYIERYRLYMKKPDLKAAQTEISRVLEQYPRYPGAYYMLGEVYMTAQNFKSAQEAALVEVKNNPGFIPAYVLAGQALNRIRDHINALAQLSTALKLNPNYVPALLEAGIANHMLKTYAAAQSMLERASQLDPGNPEIHKRLGLVYYDLGQRDKAKQQFKAYIEMYPNAPDRADMDKIINGS
jgi:tetratricopeptide (TPR) repeat protein